MAEIQAVTIAAKQAKQAGITKLKIHTDSKFMINCVTKWMSKWKVNGWKTGNNKPVINKIELIELEEALKSINVIWVSAKESFASFSVQKFSFKKINFDFTHLCIDLL